MATTDIPNDAPPTALRVRDAWLHSRGAVRIGALVAAIVALWLVLGLDITAPTKWGLGASGVLLGLAALVDSHERRLPNRLVGAAAISGLAGAVLTGRIALVVGSVAAALLGGSLLLAVRLTRGVGMGDVKMAAAMGASLGTVSVTSVAFAVAVGAALAAGFALATRRSTMPLGPSLWAGWVAALALHRGWPA